MPRHHIANSKAQTLVISPRICVPLFVPPTTTTTTNNNNNNRRSKRSGAGQEQAKLPPETLAKLRNAQRTVGLIVAADDLPDAIKEELRGIQHDLQLQRVVRLCIWHLYICAFVHVAFAHLAYVQL